MFSRLFVGLSLLFICLPFTNARAANSDQTVTLDHQLQIPGAVLKPGSYTFSVEDRMQDRAIVRIDAGKNTYYIVLTVPNGKLPPSRTRNGLILFNSKDEKKQVLEGWMCPGCASGLEFVYPKLEAAKITGDGNSVLAVDPASDKLPANLSADDMKVVTLWLLSPKRITAEDHEKGVVAEKYKGENGAPAPAQTAETSTRPTPSEPTRASTGSTSQNSPNQTSPAELAQNQVPNESAPPSRVHNHANASARLPKTASNTFSLALWGLLALVTALGLRLKRT